MNLEEKVDSTILSGLCAGRSITEQDLVIRDPSRVIRDPSRVIRDPSRVIRDASRVIRDASRVIRDPSRATRDPSRATRDPSRVIRDPSRAIRDPSRVIRDPSRAIRSLKMDTEELMKVLVEALKPWMAGVAIGHPLPGWLLHIGTLVTQEWFLVDLVELWSMQVLSFSKLDWKPRDFYTWSVCS